LTQRIIPGKDAKKNLIRYNYFALSKYSANSYAGAKFLAYLMTEDAEKRFLEKDNTLIAAQPSFWEAQKNTRISDVFARAKLDAFIPETGDQLAVFQYGLKSEFESLLSDSLDRNTNIDIGNIPNFISHGVECSIDTYLGKEVPSDCEQE
jgi:maltose-binding protein MalE